MANNRLYLVHRPTGISLCLGKAYGEGFFMPPEPATMLDYFQEVFKEGEYDEREDFVVMTENTPGWAYLGLHKGRFSVHKLEAKDKACDNT